MHNTYYYNKCIVLDEATSPDKAEGEQYTYEFAPIPPLSDGRQVVRAREYVSDHKDGHAVMKRDVPYDGIVKVIDNAGNTFFVRRPAEGGDAALKAEIARYQTAQTEYRRLTGAAEGFSPDNNTLNLHTRRYHNNPFDPTNPISPMLEQTRLGGDFVNFGAVSNPQSLALDVTV